MQIDSYNDNGTPSPIINESRQLSVSQ
jgi:hypothetical protein